MKSYRLTTVWSGLGVLALAVLPGMVSAQTAAPAGGVPQGAYHGVLTATTSSAFRLLVLGNGQAWAMYGRPMAAGLEVAGFVQGQGEFLDGRFTVSNGIDFGTTPPAPFALQGTYKAGMTVQGTADSGGYQVRFTGNAMPAQVYDYDAAALLAHVKGGWKMTALGHTDMDVQIDADGHFEAKVPEGGCAFSGRVKPHASGKNVFDFQLKFGAAPCTAAGQNAQGLAVVQGQAGSAQRLVMLGFTENRQMGAVVQAHR